MRKKIGTKAPRVIDAEFEKLWTAKQVAEFTTIPENTIKKYVTLNKIPSVKIGSHRLFIPEEIRKWVIRHAS